MVRPRRVTADKDQDQARQPRPIPASYYARPTPPEPAKRRPSIRDRLAGLRRRWMWLGAIGVLVVWAVLLSLLAGGLASPGHSQAAPPAQVGGPAATDTPGPTPVPTRTPSATPRPSPSVTPRRTPASVTFLNGPLSARRGDSPTLLVRTTPATICTITLSYPGAPQLDPATSDASGAVSWTWKVTGRTVTGTFPIAVSCGAATGTTQIVLNSDQ